MTEFEACGKTAEGFWNKHRSEDGKKLGYQQLCNKLREARKTHFNAVKPSDDILAEAAKCYFNGNLEEVPNHLFMYRKTRKWHLYKSSAKIAEIWKKLLAADLEVVKNWEVMDVQLEDD
jgi:hypothetical protein